MFSHFFKYFPSMLFFDILGHIFYQGNSAQNFAVRLDKQHSLSYHICIGVNRVKPQSANRAVILGQYIIENKATVRAAAKKFGISKSTVHKDVSQRLSKVDPSLYAKVKDILEINKQERHIRGGLATKNKYREIALKKNTIKNNTA